MAENLAYKHILKSVSLFGSVQVVQVLTTLVRGKIIAVYLGTVGVGVFSLLVSAISAMQTIFGMGLDFSAVREISKANETDDLGKISRTTAVFFRWLLFSALLGSLMLIVVGPWLSVIAFGSKDYAQSFSWLSIAIALNIFSAGYQSLLQGTRRLKEMATASVTSAIAGVLISAPLYYLWRTAGIVPALVIASLTTFAINSYFVRKINLEKVYVRAREVWHEGSEMVKLGLARMGAGLLGTLAAFLISAYIKHAGSLSDVGLYQAGISISNQYVGLVFAAIAVDYFPRLSAVSSDAAKVRDVTNQQSEMMLLIVTPILIALMLTAPLLIRILLTDEFQSIANFIRLISVGIFFQAAKQSMDLISFAKGDTRTFAMLAIAGSFLLLFSSIAGYSVFGLNGAGGMFIVHSITIFLLIYYVAHKRYDYVMSRRFLRLLLVNIFPLVSVCALLILIPTLIGYAVSGILLCSSIAFSIYKIDKLVGLKEIGGSFMSRLQGR